MRAQERKARVFHPPLLTAVQPAMLSLVEVAKHDSIDSCWVIVAGQAYDVTEFLDEHPGGASVILRFAGKVRERGRTFPGRGRVVSM